MNEINSLRIGDVDQDGITEVVITINNSPYRYIQIYNGRSHELERQSQSYDKYDFSALEIGDVDGDGQTEIIAGQESVSTTPNIVVLNGATAEEEWQFVVPPIARSLNDIHLDDVDGDGRIEIIASTDSNSIYVIDGVTHEIDATITTNSSITTKANAISSEDVDQDGTLSILIGRQNGNIDIYNGETYTLESTISLGQQVVTCLSRVDINQDTIPEWLVCGGERLSIYSTRDLSLLWQSPDLHSGLELLNQVAAGQIDDDYELEILVGSWFTLFQFESSWVGPLGLSQMTVSPKNASPGDLLTFATEMVNQTKEPILAVQANNLLPIELNYIPGSLTATRGAAEYSDGRITWNGNVDSESSVTISYQANVRLNSQRRPFVNSAEIISSNNNRMVSATVTIPPALTYLPLCRNDCLDYFDNFQNPVSRWLISDDADMKSEYLNGEYRILAKTTGFTYLIKAPTCERESYTVEVDARWGGNTGAYYGLVFGLTDDFSQYILFMVNTDEQLYSMFFVTKSGGEVKYYDKPSRYINKGSAVNHLKVTFDRRGSVKFDINGSSLMYSSLGGTDIQWPTNVGLFVIPYSNVANADARFDNFNVKVIPNVEGSSTGQTHLEPTAIQADLDHAVLSNPDWHLKPDNWTDQPDQQSPQELVTPYRRSIGR